MDNLSKNETQLQEMIEMKNKYQKEKKYLNDYIQFNSNEGLNNIGKKYDIEGRKKKREVMISNIDPLFGAWFRGVYLE